VIRPILSLEHVGVDFRLEGDVVSAVSDVSLSVMPREIVGIVGESGCGKSTLAIHRLMSTPSTLQTATMRPYRSVSRRVQLTDLRLIFLKSAREASRPQG
jgi:ABC-type glutathione transport system ATPase component